MRKLATIVCLYIFLLGLTSAAHATPESQLLVGQGRALFFNNGEPTYSGLLSANEKFEAAVAADATDQEANLFYAVTRVLASGLERGNGAGLETLRDLYEAFGITRNDNDSFEESPFNDPPEINDHYDPPETIPGGEAFRAFFAGPFVSLLDRAIANLEVINVGDPLRNPFNITLTAAETGDEAVEVDYADVLLLKSAFYTLKAFALIVTAYDLDIDIRDFIAKANADVLRIQRDLLNKYPNSLSLRGDGAASLSNARLALLNGIDGYRDAFNFITGESDYQGDDLLFFDSDEDVREANFVLTQLTELQNSLSDNRPAVFTETEETWLLTDEQGRVFVMELYKDLHGNFIEGECGHEEGCDFLCCGADVEHFCIVDSTVTIQIYADGTSCPCWATLTGNMSVDGARIISGSYNAQNPYGDWSGTFTGVLQSTKTDTETIDFNSLFGALGKGPLDIRAVVPDFGLENEIIAGTFPGDPVLNGLFPDYQTNDDVTRELELQPYGFFNVPTIADNGILIDGDPSDWQSLTLAFTDLVNDKNENADFLGMDIHKLYLAKDSAYLYMGIELCDADPKEDDSAGFVFQANASHERGDTPGDRMASVWNHTGNWMPNVGERSWYEPPTSINSYPVDYSAAGTKFIKWKVLLNDMGNLSGKFIRVYSHVTGGVFPPIYPVSDENITQIMLDSTPVSGTITCSAYNGTGNIFIWAYDGPDPNTANEIASTYISDPGHYTIEGLPIGSNVYLFARWDADGNGIRTTGDYSGKSVPHTVVSGGTTINFSLNEEVGVSLSIIPDSVRLKPGQGVTFEARGGSGTYRWAAVKGDLNTFAGLTPTAFASMPVVGHFASLEGSRVRYTAPMEPCTYSVAVTDGTDVAIARVEVISLEDAIIYVEIPGGDIHLGSGEQNALVFVGHLADLTVRDFTGRAQWSSDHPEVVEAGTGGILTAKSAGTATVTATYGELEARITVLVEATSVGLIVEPTLLYLSEGHTQVLSIFEVMASGHRQEVSPGSCTLSADPGLVIAVNESGRVTAVSPGQGEVLITCGELTSRVAVFVSPDFPLGVTPRSLTVPAGKMSEPIRVTGGEPPYVLTTDSGQVRGSGDTWVYEAPMATGTYTVTITDQANQQVSVTVEVVSSLTLSPQVADLSPGEEVNFTAIGGTGSYSWTATSGTFDTNTGVSVKYTTPQVQGVYKVTVSDSRGQSLMAIVNVEAGMVVSPQEMILALGEEKGFQISGGTPPYTVAVSAGEYIRDRETHHYTAPEVAGQYRITISDQDGRQESIEVTVGIPLTASPSELFLNPEGEADITITGGYGAYYATASMGIVTLQEGKLAYKASHVAVPAMIFLTDQAGAETQVEIHVSRESFFITPGMTFLKPGEAFDLRALGGTAPHTWRVEGEGSLSSTSDQKVTYTGPGVTGTYSILATDNAGLEARAEVVAYEGSLRIAPELLLLAPGGQARVQALFGVHDYEWTVERGNLSGTSGTEVTYTAPQTGEEDLIRLQDATDKTVTIRVVLSGEEIKDIADVYAGGDGILDDQEMSQALDDFFSGQGWVTPQEMYVLIERYLAQ